MKYLTIGSTLLWLSPACLSHIVGVSPQDQAKYVPDANNKWACLTNPEIILDFNQVNDDYCDCPDGSDEPGTHACPQTSFYCENKGHVPSYIKGSLVNDGKCDYEQCCDGSDEWNTPVDCPNRCVEIHQQFEKELKLKRNSYKIGVDKAIKTVRAADRLRSKLEDELKALKAVVDFTSNELAKHEAEAREIEKSEVNKQHDKKVEKTLNPLRVYIFDKYNIFIQSKKNLDTLNSILKTLKDTFNENLNDAAVRLTIQRYDAHLDNFKDDYDQETDLDIEKIQKQVFRELDERSLGPLKENIDKNLETVKSSLQRNNVINERISDLETILGYLIENYNPNFNDPNVKESVRQYQDYAVNKPQNKIPSDFLQHVESEFTKLGALVLKAKDKEDKHNAKEVEEQLSFQANLVEIENKLSIFDKIRLKFRRLVADFLGVSPVQKPSRVLSTKPENFALVEELKKNLKEAQDNVDKLEADLSRDLGPQDILRPLEEITLNGKIGEYDYEVTYLKEIHQKGQNNHNVKIGSFDHYEVEEIEGDDDSLLWRLHYSNGARCWNGPLRSGVVTITCGSQAELIGVSEPEKCEYHFRVKAPIGCKIKDE